MVQKDYFRFVSFPFQVYNIDYEQWSTVSVFKENLRISNVIFNYFLNSLWCGTHSCYYCWMPYTHTMYSSCVSMKTVLYAEEISGIKFMFV